MSNEIPKESPDLRVAKAAFVTERITMGADPAKVLALVESSWLPALADAENLPAGSLDLLTRAQRDARAEKIGADQARIVCASIVK